MGGVREQHISNISTVAIGQCAKTSAGVIYIFLQNGRIMFVTHHSMSGKKSTPAEGLRGGVGTGAQALPRVLGAAARRHKRSARRSIWLLRCSAI